MDDRALPLDEEEITPRGTVRHEPLGGTGEKIGDDRVDGDAPAGDGDARLAGRYEDGAEPTLPGGAIELDRHRLLPDRAVRAHRQDDRGVMREVRPFRDAQVRRGLAEVADLRAMLAARTASRIPPDFASLRFTPCAISAQ